MVKTRRNATESQQTPPNASSDNEDNGDIGTPSEQRIMNMMQQMLAQQLEDQRRYFEDKIAGLKSTSDEESNESPVTQKFSEEEPSEGDTRRKRKRDCSFKTFLGCQPPKYEGSPDLVITNKWISEMEQTFEASECEDYQRVMFAVKMLKGRALTWWNTVSKALNHNELKDMTWAKFIRKLKAKYCADRDVQKLEGEFLNLKKGSMSIDEYAATFVDKMEFATDLVPNERTKISRFVAGLPSDYQLPVKEMTTLDQAINKAKDVEDMLVMRGVERKSFGEGKKFSGSSGSHKKGRFSENEKKTSPGDDTKWCSKCKKKHKGACGEVRCFKCGKLGHYSYQCTYPDKKCFSCQEMGHISTDCPKNNSGGGNAGGPKKDDVRKPKGRAFMMTVDEAKDVNDVVSGMLG